MLRRISSFSKNAKKYVSLYTIVVLVCLPFVSLLLSMLLWSLELIFIVNFFLFIPTLVLLRHKDSLDGNSIWLLREKSYLIIILAIPSAIYWVSVVATGWVQTGWDTPGYIYLARILREQGLATFLMKKSGNSFLYEMLLCAFSPVDPNLFGACILLPWLFSVMVVVLIILLVGHWFKRTSTALVAGISTATWLALYRFMADLHKTLFSLVLLLITAYYIVRMYKTEKPLYYRSLILGLSALFLMSWVQIEMALLTGGIVLLYNLCVTLSHRKRTQTIRFGVVLCGLALVITPAFLFALMFSSHFLGFVPGLAAVPVWEVILVFAYPSIILILFSVAALIISLTKNKSPPALFLFVWVFLVLALVLASYPFPIPLRKFAERLLFLFPTPLLVSFGFQHFTQTWNRCSVSAFSPRYLKFADRRQIEGILLISVFFSGMLFVIPQASLHLRPFISDTAYNQLFWGREHLETNSSTVFIIYDNNGLGRLHDNWIGAFFGAHRTFVGGLHFILLMQIPITSDEFTNQFAYQNLFDLTNGHELHLSDVLTSKVFIVSSFYYANQTPFESTLLIEVGPGFYQLNATNALNAAATGYRIACAREPLSLSSNWEMQIANWTWTDYSLVLKPSNGTVSANVTYCLPVVAGMNNISLNLFDGNSTSSPLEISINGTEIGVYNYTSTYSPKSVSFSYLSPYAGVVLLTIQLKDPFAPCFAELDYIDVSFES